VVELGTLDGMLKPADGKHDEELSSVLAAGGALPTEMTPDKGWALELPLDPLLRGLLRGQLRGMYAAETRSRDKRNSNPSAVRERDIL